MRVTFEPWLVEHKVDVVLAGHVHSYERTVSSIKRTCFLYLDLVINAKGVY